MSCAAVSCISGSKAGATPSWQAPADRPKHAKISYGNWASCIQGSVARLRLGIVKWRYCSANVRIVPPAWGKWQPNALWMRLSWFESRRRNFLELVDYTDFGLGSKQKWPWRVVAGCDAPRMLST